MVEDALVTEAGSDPAAGYESRETEDLVALINAEDATVPSAVAEATSAIAAAVDAIAERLRSGGRLVYVGAGSSGRIAALDASECEATFATAPGTVVALVAGGETAPPLAQAAAEDDGAAGARDVGALAVGPSMPSSASARAAARRTCSARSGGARGRRAHFVRSRGICLRARSLADHEIAVVVGPEFIAGSTRLKAGTAQKLVLNAISTIAMIRLGKTYGNLMVDVVAANEKLQERVRRIVGAATGVSSEKVDAALGDADGSASVAIVSLLAGVDARAARARLDASDGSIARALEDAP